MTKFIRKLRLSQEEPYSPSMAQTEINKQEIFSDCDCDYAGGQGVSAASQPGALQLPMEVPQTPVDVGDGEPATLRTSPSIRMHADEPDDHDSKRARVESSKKLRLQRISAEHCCNGAKSENF